MRRNNAQFSRKAAKISASDESQPKRSLAIDNHECASDSIGANCPFSGTAFLGITESMMQSPDCFVSSRPRSQQRISAVVDSFESNESLEICAKRHGVSAEELTSWRALFLAGVKSQSAAKLPRRSRWRMWSAALCGFVAVLVSSNYALSSAREAPDLIVFQSGEAARAADVNANFSLLKQWIESKLGPATTSEVLFASPVYAQDDMVSEGGFGLTIRASVDGAIENQTWHAIKLWTQVVTPGTLCTKTCGEALCLTSYLDDATAKQVDCANSTSQRMCVCLGRKE
jgi:hypothetical protein